MKAGDRFWASHFIDEGDYYHRSDECLGFFTSRRKAIAAIRKSQTGDWKRVPFIEDRKPSWRGERWFEIEEHVVE